MSVSRGKKRRTASCALLATMLLASLLTGCSPSLIGAIAMSSINGRINIRVLACTGVLDKAVLYKGDSALLREPFAKVGAGEAADWRLDFLIEGLSDGALAGDRQYEVRVYSKEGIAQPVRFSKQDLTLLPSGSLLMAGMNEVPQVVDREVFEREACSDI